MARGHQHFCSFPTPSHAFLSCSCSAESVETTKVPTWTAFSKATCLENFNTESLARAWSPSEEHRNPGRRWLGSRSRAALGSWHFHCSLENSHRSDRNCCPTASAEIRTSWVLLKETTPILFGEWGRGETFRNFPSAENLTPKCSSHTDLECNLLWNSNVPTTQESQVSAPYLRNRHLEKTPSSIQVTAYTAQRQSTSVLLIAF